MTYDINSRINAMHMANNDPARTTSFLKDDMNEHPVKGLIQDKVRSGEGEDEVSTADMDRAKKQGEYTRDKRMKHMGAMATSDAVNGIRDGYFSGWQGKRPLEDKVANYVDAAVNSDILPSEVLIDRTPSDKFEGLRYKDAADWHLADDSERKPPVHRMIADEPGRAISNERHFMIDDAIKNNQSLVDAATAKTPFEEFFDQGEPPEDELEPISEDEAFQLWLDDQDTTVDNSDPKSRWDAEKDDWLAANGLELIQ